MKVPNKIEMQKIREATIKGLQAGQVFVVSRTFNEEDILQFARLSRDYNPIHFNDAFVKSKKLDRRICHGLLVAGMLTEIGGQIGWLASGMDLKFLKPVYINDTINCEFTIIEITQRNRAKAEVVFKNQSEEIVLTAVLTGILPSKQEREILKSIEKNDGKICGSKV